MRFFLQTLAYVRFFVYLCSRKGLKHIDRMNKHLFSYILLGIAIVFAACDPNVAFYPEWIGEYSIISIKTVYPNGICEEKLIEEGKVRETGPYGHEYEHEKDFSSYPPLSIFNDKGLFVQTLGIGDPFNPDVDPVDHVLFVRSPKHRILKNDSIEHVTLTDNFRIVLVDGMIFTIRDNHMISPKPIKVLRANSDSLVLQNGKQFDVTLTNADGSVAGTAHNHWTYSSVKKENDICTFDAELHVYKDSIEQPYIYRHHLVFRKK